MFEKMLVSRLRKGLLWFGGVGLVLTGPVGLWLINEGAVHTNRLLLAYWVCGLIWIGAFTHWMLDIPEVNPE